MDTKTSLLRRLKRVEWKPILERAAIGIAIGWVIRNMLATIGINEVPTAEIEAKFLAASQNLLHIALTLTAYAAFKRELSKIGMAACVLAGVGLSHFGVIDTHLHQFLVEFSLYPPVFVTIASDGSVNPQYAKLLLFVIFTGILAARVSKPAERTMDRTFILIAVCSVLATTAIFHRVIPAGSLADQKQDARYILNYATKLQGAEQKKYCDYLAVQCSEVSDVDDARETIQKNEINPDTIGVTRDLDPGATIQSSTGAFGRFGFRVKTIIYKPPHDGKKGVLVIDTKHLQMAQWKAEIQFSFMAILAHGTWILIALGLITLHKSRARFKISHPEQAQSDQRA